MDPEKLMGLVGKTSGAQFTPAGVLRLPLEGLEEQRRFWVGCGRDSKSWWCRDFIRMAALLSSRAMSIGRDCRSKRASVNLYLRSRVA